MATTSITEEFVIKDDATCQRLIDAIEEFEANADKKPVKKSGPSSYERGKALLAARYSR